MIGESLNDAALNAFATRVLGAVAADVDFGEMPDSDGGHRYEFEASGGKLLIRASNTLCAARGLHEYIKTALGRRVCWDTHLPLGPVAIVDHELVAGEARCAAGYYMNFCTFSYTTAYWDWTRWEREIDWMALHGLSMPLSAVGHEAILAGVYREMGLSDEDVRVFLGGPGYLPFHYMGCLDGWAGQMTPGWIDQHAELGARIITRERDLGMTPVLPAFTGQVPAQLARHDTTTREWMGFTTHFLDHRDPRFRSISRRVVELQRELFGTSHLYAADPFIEMVPPDGDEAYLATIASAVLGGLVDGDEDAVWVMQAWTFGYLDHFWTDRRVAALLDAIPNERMLILDLWGEFQPQWKRFGGFRGKRWMWCVLHNFGGRCDLFGSFGAMSDELTQALFAPEPPIGYGLAMEAIEQNEAIYELATDLAWRAADDLADWAGRFGRQRYGTDSVLAAEAWTDLATTVYSAPPTEISLLARPGIVTQRPRVSVVDAPADEPPFVQDEWYDRATLVRAWRALNQLGAAEPALVAGELGHDLATVAATVLAREADDCFRRLVDCWQAVRRGDEPRRTWTAAAGALVAVLGDLDQVLGHRLELTLFAWEARALAWADDESFGVTLRDNARRIVTAWDSPERTRLADYSARLWSGLVGDYYTMRWRAWLDECSSALDDDRVPDGLVLEAAMQRITRDFIAGASAGASGGAGARPSNADLVADSTRLLAAYAPRLTTNGDHP